MSANRQREVESDNEGKREKARFFEVGFLENGSEGIRTPDLLDANEARSQLRHRPKQRQKL